ncbi:MAG: LemA family protein, partial [Proteobacteria bacterium]|nr:LemA family protein [Pseudomonadota bacterium]MBS0541982.1 LemA family protein [Pseudomonadota bacterium]
MTTWIIVGIIVAIGLWLIATYNGLVGGRNQTQT